MILPPPTPRTIHGFALVGCLAVGAAAAVPRLDVTPVSAMGCVADGPVRSHAAGRSRVLAQETRTPATPTPTATAGPSPTWEVREFEGLYGAAFEYSGFVEGADCPEHGIGWWLTSEDRRFAERFDEIRGERSRFVSPVGETTSYIVQARFVGRLSPPGRYGHLDSYTHEVVVTELLELEATDRCGMDLPDLALADYSFTFEGALPSGCVTDLSARPLVQLCIVNQGRLPAGPSWVALNRDGAAAQRLRLCNLLPGESRCLPPAPLPVSHVELDVDDEVHERFEGNDWIWIGDPTLEPPPSCTVLPPGRPSLTPPPPPTLQACVTPTASPTPDVETPGTPTPGETAKVGGGVVYVPLVWP